MNISCFEAWKLSQFVVFYSSQTHTHIRCYVRQSILLSSHTFSSSEKYIVKQRENWKSADRQDTAGYFWYKTRVSFQILNKLKQ